MLKKGLLVISITFQVFLVGFMTFIIFKEKKEPAIIEDIFSLEDTSKVAWAEEPLFNHPFKSCLQTTGVIVPSSGYVKVTNPLEGRVEHVFVSIGDEVKLNAPLFKIQDKNIHVEIKEKEARLEKAVAELNFQKRAPSKYAVLRKQKAIEEIEIKKKNQEKEAKVYESLLEETAVSNIETNEKHMFLQITEKELEKANADYDELCSQISVEEEEIFLNDIEEKKASLKQSTLKLESALVKSPMKGRVVDVTVSKGTYLNDRGQLGVTIIQEEPAMIKVCINEEDAHKLRLSRNLRAVAVHKSNPDIHFILDYAYFNPKMSIYRNDKRKLDLYFTFEKGRSSIYMEQSFDVYIEKIHPVDLSFLHYKFQ
ncbi:MAG: hypothetical protein S4CHLAM20_13850 [Chlamydiia bacterium]|nr:hypothetical protein [Chlamydiia bacterium]